MAERQPIDPQLKTAVNRALHLLLYLEEFVDDVCGRC